MTVDDFEQGHPAPSTNLRTPAFKVGLYKHVRIVFTGYEPPMSVYYPCQCGAALYRDAGYDAEGRMVVTVGCSRTLPVSPMAFGSDPDPRYPRHG